MNAPVERANVQATALSTGSALEPVAAPHRALAAVAPAADDKICWVAVSQAPYHPNQQVELLHLQAEAEALLLQLQTKHQRRPRNLDGAVTPSTV